MSGRTGRGRATELELDTRVRESPVSQPTRTVDPDLLSDPTIYRLLEVIRCTVPRSRH